MIIFVIKSIQQSIICPHTNSYAVVGIYISLQKRVFLSPPLYKASPSLPHWSHQSSFVPGLILHRFPPLFSAPYGYGGPPISRFSERTLPCGGLRIPSPAACQTLPQEAPTLLPLYLPASSSAEGWPEPPDSASPVVSASPDDESLTTQPTTVRSEDRVPAEGERWRHPEPPA